MALKGSAGRLAQLIAAGFKDVGYWQLDVESCVLFVGQAPTEPGVYVFAVKDEVSYVGSAQGGIAKRFRKYTDPKNPGGVAVRIRRCIADALKIGAEGRVLTAAASPMSWNGLPIDFIAGLEEGLIRSFHPKWNVRGLGVIRLGAKNLTEFVTISEKRIALGRTGLAWNGAMRFATLH